MGVQQRQPNGLDHTIGVREDLPVPEPQHAIADLRQPGRTMLVAFNALSVPTAIQLDNQVLRHASEIGDVTSDRNLSTKSETLKLLAPQQ